VSEAKEGGDERAREVALEEEEISSASDGAPFLTRPPKLVALGCKLHQGRDTFHQLSGSMQRISRWGRYAASQPRGG